MSNCWKCGRELPDGRVECEYGCGAGGRLVPGIEEPTAEELDLAKELKTGHIACVALARHVSEMGAGGMLCRIKIGGRIYSITVKREAA